MSDYRDILTLSDDTRALKSSQAFIPYSTMRETIEVCTRDDGSVVLRYRESKHERGFSGPDSTFSTWTTLRRTIMTQRADGVIEARHYEHKKKSWVTVLHYANNFAGATSAGELFEHMPVLREAVRRYFDMDRVPSSNAVFPLLGSMGEPDYAHVPGTPFYRGANDLRDVCIRMFGIRRSADDEFYKAFENSTLSSRYDAWLLRGLVGDDVLQLVMKATSGYRQHLHYTWQRSSLRRVRRDILEDALRTDVAHAFMLLRDLPMTVDVPSDAATLEEAHDTMVAMRRKQIAPDPINSAIMLRTFVRAWDAHMTRDDVQSLTRELFDKDYRRDLVKAIAPLGYTTVYVGWLFAGTVPIDWIIDFYRRNATQQHPYYAPGRRFVATLRSLDVSSKRKILKLSTGELSELAMFVGADPRVIVSPKIESVNALRETCRRQKVRLGELHTDLHTAAEAMMSETERKRIEAKRIEDEARKARRAQVVEKVNGVTKAGLRVEMATSYQQIAAWGEELSNCIGGYAARLDRDVLGGVYDSDDSLVCNFQINEGGQLTQFYGYKNWELSVEMTHDLLDYLEPLCTDAQRTQWMNEAVRAEQGEGRRPVARTAA